MPKASRVGVSHDGSRASDNLRASFARLDHPGLRFRTMLPIASARIADAKRWRSISRRRPKAAYTSLQGQGSRMCMHKQGIAGVLGRYVRPTIHLCSCFDSHMRLPCPTREGPTRGRDRNFVTFQIANAAKACFNFVVCDCPASGGGRFDSRPRRCHENRYIHWNTTKSRRTVSRRR
jgi:hypothetical protein